MRKEIQRNTQEFYVVLTNLFRVRENIVKIMGPSPPKPPYLLSKVVRIEAIPCSTKNIHI